MKSNGTILSTNVFAPDGLVSRLSWLTTSGGGTASCWGDYLFDWQGNAVHCLFSGGNLIEDGEPLVHAAYNTWGQRNSVYNNGAWPDLLRFGYNARWGYKLDTETGLYYCQHRYYDPANGRWLTRDPMGSLADSMFMDTVLPMSFQWKTNRVYSLGHLLLERVSPSQK